MKCLYPEELTKNLSARTAIEDTISGLKIGQRLAEPVQQGQLRVDYHTSSRITAANGKRFFRDIRIFEKTNRNSKGEVYVYPFWSVTK